MRGIGVSHATLISIVVEAFFFGIFLVLFTYGHATSVQRRRLDRPVNYTLWIASGVMVVLALAHLATDAERLPLAFLNFDADPAVFLSDLRTPTYALKTILMMLQMLLGDICIIYRLFIIWARSYRVIAVPLILLVGYITSCAGLLHAILTVSRATSIFRLPVWANALTVTSLATNLLCSGLIAYRIWRTAVRRSLRRERRIYLSILAAIVESGAFYSLTLIAMLAAYQDGSYGHYIVLDAIPAVVGITFTMINLRIAQGHGLPFGSSHSSGSSSPTTHRAFELHVHPALSAESDAKGGDLPFYSMRPTSGGIANVTHLSTIDEASTYGERSKIASSLGASTMMSTSTMRGVDEVYGGDPFSSDGHR